MFNNRLAGYRVSKISFLDLHINISRVFGIIHQYLLVLLVSPASQYIWSTVYVF